jgi:TRAP-type mannitol/chloroaromatic compound transport system permease large subunit
MTWLAANIAPVMFLSLVLFLLTGFPVAFSLAACGMVFGFIGIELGLVPPALMQALPLRLIGIMQNDTLLAIPFFTFMGLILERSGMAEDLLETVGQVFGPVRGGLALAVIVVGAMLAATTGVVAASVISMGLISLPIMLRYGYNRPLAAGAITASGTLAQIVPPSLVLIVIADQLGRSVGDMYAAAFLPAFMLIGLYCVFIFVVAVLRPNWVPALPVEARIYREADGASGHRSLVVLAVFCTAVALTFASYYPEIVRSMTGNPEATAPTDETVVLSLCVGVLLAFVIAVISKGLRLGLLSRLAQQVTFVLIPPLLLIFLVLGTIFLGVATPTEGGAMGATGALILAFLRRRMDMPLLKQALNTTAKLSVFVVFVLVGSTVFSLTFTAVDGPRWVEHLFDKLPGGQIGFLIVVNLIIFILGCFLDFFEIAFILLPLLAPIAVKMDIDLVWFGIIVAMNLQTSFLTPPFGFALFYLRSVAPSADYDDRVTGKRIGKMTTGDIYRGSIAFVFMQLVMVAVVIAFPALTLDSLGKKSLVDPATVNFDIPSDTAPSGDGGAIGMGNEPGAGSRDGAGEREKGDSDGKIDMGPAPGAEGTDKQGAAKEEDLGAALMRSGKGN